MNHFLQGESDAILKVNGDSLLSGSFVTSGRAICKVIHVGKEVIFISLPLKQKNLKAKNQSYQNRLTKF